MGQPVAKPCATVRASLNVCMSPRTGSDGQLFSCIPIHRTTWTSLIPLLGHLPSALASNLTVTSTCRRGTGSAILLTPVRGLIAAAIKSAAADERLRASTGERNADMTQRQRGSRLGDLIPVQVVGAAAFRLRYDWLNSSTAAAALVLYLVPALLLQEAFPEAVSPAADNRCAVACTLFSAFFMPPLPVTGFVICAINSTEHNGGGHRASPLKGV